MEGKITKTSLDNAPLPLQIMKVSIKLQYNNGHGKEENNGRQNTGKKRYAVLMSE